MSHSIMQPQNLHCTQHAYYNLFLSVALSLPLISSGCSKISEPSEEYPYNKDISFADIQPSWSPDGQWIVYYHGESSQEGQSGLYRIRPDRTGREFLTDLGKMPNWSPDGERIVHTKLAATQLYLYDFNIGYSTRITDDPLNKTFPSWHPNGLEVLYTVRAGPDTIYGTWSYNLETEENTRIIPYWGTNSSFNPVGSKIVFIEEAVTGQYLSQFNIATKTVDRLVDAEELGTHGLEYPSYDKDGKRILFQTHQSGYPIKQEAQVWVYDIVEDSQTLLIDGGYSPAWNPDCTKIVYTRFKLYDQREVEGNGYLWVMNLENKTLYRLTYASTDEISNY